jgi:hypothetical protein
MSIRTIIIVAIFMFIMAIVGGVAFILMQKPKPAPKPAPSPKVKVFFPVEKGSYYYQGGYNAIDFVTPVAGQVALFIQSTAGNANPDITIDGVEAKDVGSGNSHASGTRIFQTVSDLPAGKHTMKAAKGVNVTKNDE